MAVDDPSERVFSAVRRVPLRRSDGRGALVGTSYGRRRSSSGGLRALCVLRGSGGSLRRSKLAGTPFKMRGFYPHEVPKSLKTLSLATFASLAVQSVELALHDGFRNAMNHIVQVFVDVPAVTSQRCSPRPLRPLRFNRFYHSL